MANFMGHNLGFLIRICQSNLRTAPDTEFLLKILGCGP
jgi:hypothetical protein